MYTQKCMVCLCMCAFVCVCVCVCVCVFPLQNVINQFTALATNPRLTFLGNVRVGRDIGLPELRAHYNAVVLCYGAESDRRLGVPGEVGGPFATPTMPLSHGFSNLADSAADER
jgi:hypothetical protein